MSNDKWISHPFHMNLKPTHEHPASKNPNLPPRHPRTAKKTSTRSLPQRAMTFLQRSSQLVTPEPSWWQEGRTLLLYRHSCYCCRPQSFYNIKTIWHDSFCLLFCYEQLPQLIKREFVGASVCLVAIVDGSFHTITTMGHGVIAFW